MADDSSNGQKRNSDDLINREAPAGISAAANQEPSSQATAASAAIENQPSIGDAGGVRTLREGDQDHRAESQSSASTPAPAGGIAGSQNHTPLLLHIF